MLAIVAQAAKDNAADYPQKIERLDEYPGYKQIFKKVKSFITDVSEQHNLAIENLASKKQINQFLSWYFDLNEAKKLASSTDVYPEILITWRHELFGKALQNFANNGFK